MDRLEFTEHVFRAAAALDRAGGPAADLRGRLRLAAEEFWAAMFDYDGWPAPMRAAADGVLPLLFAGGLIRESIDRMDEAGLAELAARLGQFVEAAATFLS